MDEKKNLIITYITEDECCYMNDCELFDCDSCGSLEECYMEACERCNVEFAESVDYGGYANEEDYWSQIFD